MKKIMTCASLAAMLLLGAGTASAGGRAGTFGVGAEALLSGDGGLSLNYDTGTFHAGGFLSFDDEAGDENTDIGFGGRLFWHLHSTDFSDFSIGGNLGVMLDNEPGDDNSSSLIYLEPAVQIRAFIASNVALSFTAGIWVGLGDADGAHLGSQGQVTGAAGVHYYFF